jgi:hypothetical protein
VYYAALTGERTKVAATSLVFLKPPNLTPPPLRGVSLHASTRWYAAFPKSLSENLLVTP